MSGTGTAAGEGVLVAITFAMFADGAEGLDSISLGILGSIGSSVGLDESAYAITSLLFLNAEARAMTPRMTPSRTSINKAIITDDISEFLFWATSAACASGLICACKLIVIVGLVSVLSITLESVVLLVNKM